MSPTDQRLAESRRLIGAVSILTGVSGLLPLPGVSDLSQDLLRLFLLRRLARRRGIDLTADAALVLVGAHQVSTKRLALSTLLTVAARVMLRRLTRTLLVLLRVEDMTQTFLFATLFDYYCLRYHPGGSIDRAQAEVLRRVIEEALTRGRPLLLRTIFHRVTEDLLRTGGRLPRQIGSVLLSVLRRRDDQVVRAIEVDVDGVFARLTQRLEQEIATSYGEVFNLLSEALDEVWRKRGEGEAGSDEAGSDEVGGDETARGETARGETGRGETENDE